MAAADVAALQPAPMDDDSTPRDAPLRRHRDADRRRGRIGHQLPNRRGASMAQDRTLAAGEQGSHLAPVGGGHRMPDEVDAAVNLVEAGVAQAMLISWRRALLRRCLIWRPVKPRPRSCLLATTPCWALARAAMSRSDGSASYW